MASIINTGISALNAFKRQMETTGHNIANVNTPGYSRQRVELDARQPQGFPQGYIGSGVEISAVSRSYDNYLAGRVRDYTSSHQEFSVYSQRAAQIDNVIADASAGVDEVLQNFFDSINDVADDPTSIPARTVMLDRAAQLTERFQTLNGWLEDIRHRLNQDFENQVNEINALAQSLADVNAQARTMTGASGMPPNDVLDERDRLVDELSRYTNVSTVEQSDGSLNVFVGTGQALVVGTTFNRLAVVNNAQSVDRKEIVITQAGGQQVNVSAQMSGGSLGGLLRFRDEVLDETHNALGRMAIGIGSYTNAEHRSGMDLDGDLGGDLFALPGPQVLAGSGNSGSISVDFAEVANLTTDEYQLDYDGSAWTLTNLGSGASVPMTGAGTSASPFVVDGMQIVVGSAAAGDTYLIRPTRLGAAGIGLIVRDERDIAAADPIQASVAAANSGTGVMGAGALSARTGNSKLAAPLTLQFDATNNRFDVFNGSPPSGAPIGTVAYNPATDAGSTLGLNIAGLGTFSFTMSGTPADADQFVLADNTGGVGDNRNARHLADLQTANLMFGRTASFADVYGAMIADVGTKTAQAETGAGMQERLLAQAEAAKSEVSGVNLDEEAADLVRFQQAYQAAAQVINVANSLFDSLLGAVRR